VKKVTQAISSMRTLPVMSPSRLNALGIAIMPAPCGSNRHSTAQHSTAHQVVMMMMMIGAGKCLNGHHASTLWQQPTQYSTARCSTAQ
jgi:hypothetical protein